jgi:hypothetical protein
MHNRITFGKRRIVAAALLTLFALGVVTARRTSLPASAGGPKPLGAVADKNLTPSASPAIQDEPCLCNLPLLPWSAVAATGAVDEDTLPHFAFNDPAATFSTSSTSLGPLTFRYNVTNPGHDTVSPGWAHLVLSSHVPAAGGVVRATLYKVNPCNGVKDDLCTVINNQVTEGPECRACEFNPADINFQNFHYFVNVQLERANTVDPSPLAYSVRLRP